MSVSLLLPVLWLVGGVEKAPAVSKLLSAQGHLRKAELPTPTVQDTLQSELSFPGGWFKLLNNEVKIYRGGNQFC